MKRFRANSAGCLVLLVILCGAGFAQITPSADSYTNTADPTTNYGAATLLNVGSTTEVAYIQFNLASIPSNANISQATLKLYVNSVTTPSTFQIEYIAGAWTESKIDASNAPTLGLTIQNDVFVSSKNQYVLADVTAAVQAWLNGSQPNYGLALVADSTLVASFDSKENTTTSHPPELDIAYAGGDGTITGVTTASGSGLIGGGTSGTLNLGLIETCATNQVLQWSGSAWVCASLAGTGTVTSVNSGLGLTGGPITGSGTLAINTSVVPQLTASNTFTGNQYVVGNLEVLNNSSYEPFAVQSSSTFGTWLQLSNTSNGGSTWNILSAGSTNAEGAGNLGITNLAGGTIWLEGPVNVSGNQTVTGNVSATGVLSGTGFQIGSNLFGYGSYANYNAFLGFSGNTTMTGEVNTAIGVLALNSNTGGYNNTASGVEALYNNTTGSWNTATGEWALYYNTTGNNNTGSGFEAGFSSDGTKMTGSSNTFLGAYAEPTTGTLNNAGAIGANAMVAESNALVLGSIYGLNDATVNTNVGIGTTKPSYQLHLGNQGGNPSTGFLRIEGPTQTGTSVMTASFGGAGDFGIDGPGVVEGRFVVKDSSGFVGINTANPDTNLSVNGNADKSGGGSWATFSDRRLKDLGGTFNSGLDQVLKLQPIRYRYKDDNGMGIRDHEEHVGFVAQEVQKVIPEAVTENSKGYLLVNNDPILWTMLNAIKEQQKLIQKQQQRIRAQQTEMKELTRQVHEVQATLRANREAKSSLHKTEAEIPVVRQ